MSDPRLHAQPEPIIWLQDNVVFCDRCGQIFGGAEAAGRHYTVCPMNPEYLDWVADLCDESWEKNR